MGLGRTNSSCGGAARRRRLPVLAVAGLVALAWPAAARAGTPGAELLPNLQTLAIAKGGLYVERVAKTGRTKLRLSNSVANVGAGPLELTPEPEPVPHDDCNGDGNWRRDRLVDQTVYLDANSNGTFERGVDTATTAIPDVGCRYYYPPHAHYHFEDFARYKLRAVHGGTVATASKISFCLLDDLDVEGAPLYYGGEGCDQVGGVTGISPGRGDLYVASLPGQSVNVTGVTPGRYCLVSTVDPDNLLTESDETDNSHRTLIHLNAGRQRVRRLPGGCQS